METEKSKKRISSKDQSLRRKYGKQSLGSPSHGGSLPINENSPLPAGPSGQRARNLKSISIVTPGTVMAMQPSLPVIASVNDSVTDVARVMAGRRVDAVLITDAETASALLGIVTDKDLTYRVVAEGLDPLRTKIGKIMTPDPVFVKSSASVDEAMNKMLNGHFRHLPVVDESKIVGLLDITKVVQHIQAKIKNSWGKAQQLQRAFQEFRSSWQNFHTTPEVETWFQDWSSRMVEPMLTHSMHEAPQVTIKTSVKDAAIMMKQARQTAVLVYNNQKLCGIFTTKDICLRVLAPNDNDPKTLSVARVLTPNPDVATDGMTVNEALKKMHDGHYLHLPVVSSDMTSYEVVGMVDVLSLTYSTMETLLKQQAMNPLTPAVSKTSDDTDGTNNPLWSQFWSAADFPGEDSDDGSSTRTARKVSGALSNHSGDSPRVRKKGGLIGRPPSMEGSQSGMSSMMPTQLDRSSFVFKFRDPVTGTMHRFSHRMDTDEGRSPFITLLEAVLNKIGFELVMECEPEKRQERILDHYYKFQSITGRKIQLELPLLTEDEKVLMYHFRFSYRDEENDPVLIVTDGDLLDAVDIARSFGWPRLSLFVEGLVEFESGRKVPLNSVLANFQDRKVPSRTSLSPDLWSVDDTVVDYRTRQEKLNLSNNWAFWAGIAGAAAFGVLVASRFRR